MYTSGSTAEPKGVLITHKCILNCSQGLYDIFNPMFDKDSVHLAYLPLAHIYEVMCEILFLGMGVGIGYSSSLTMSDKSPGIETGTCKGDISVLRPTYMSCVPLVLDRIRKSILEAVDAKGTIFRIFFNFAIKYKSFWKKNGFQTPILNRLLFDRLRTIVGGRLKLLTVGGAPLSPETQLFIETSLDARLLAAYGMTEIAGACTLTDLDDYSIGRVGGPVCTSILPLVEWEDGNYYPTDKPYPRGELLVGGKCLSNGYFKKDELTQESFREENGMRWFYTGDIVEIHPDGCIKVIDRKKDLIKLQYGEYVPLGKVESVLKTCPLMDNICVFGNGFKDYVVALMVPNRVQLELLAKELGKERMDIQSLCADEEMNECATKIVQKHGKSCNLMRKEIPKYVKLCSEEWLPESGFVTGALKVRRKVIQNFYKETLENLMKKN
ncbi:long chain acyl-CoA synthetase 8-like [Centruroides sculpturatus]|uniref:long chain acyl-CoA synthetase 8-like n=1 Tax=Centruroides sculpturatus TaxID=218467 RepID=UPI000C6E0E5B|nr:long chain acyl-CoA synthetase 8-like [Centruroides sculpturatus]